MFTHVESFKSAFLEKLETMYGKSFKDSTTRDDIIRSAIWCVNI